MKTPTLLLTVCVLFLINGCRHFDVGASVSYKPRADLPEIKIELKTPKK
jgi:hypothetical protein